MTAFDWFLAAFFYCGTGNALTCRWWLRAKPELWRFDLSAKIVAFTVLVITWPFEIKAHL